MYQKNSSYIKPFEELKTLSKVEMEDSPSVINPSYTKVQGTQLPHVFIIVFSGGRKTEKNYFYPILKHPEKFPTLILRFEPDDIILKNNEPRVFSTAYAMQDSYAKAVVKDVPDKYFIVTDVDLFMPSILKHKPLCEARGITLIISNPCFEVWNYYSKYTDKFIGFIPPSKPAKLSHELKIYVHTRTNPQIKERTAIYDLVANISTSILNYTEDTNKLPDLYSTNMHLLGEELINIGII